MQRFVIQAIRLVVTGDDHGKRRRGRIHKQYAHLRPHSQLDCAPMSAGSFDPAFAPPLPPSPPASPPALAAASPPGAPPLTRAFRALGLLAAEGASLGFAGWSLRARDHLLNYVASNSMAPAARKYVF